jgi:hypothetical protein
MAELAGQGFVPGQPRASCGRGLDRRVARDGTSFGRGFRSSVRHAPACGHSPIVARCRNAWRRPPAVRGRTATPQSRAGSTTCQRAGPGSDPVRSSCWRWIGPTTDPTGARPLRILRRWTERSRACSAAARCVPGFQPRDLAHEQPDDQRLRLVDHDLPARSTFAHFRHSAKSSAVCKPRRALSWCSQECCQYRWTIGMNRRNIAKYRYTPPNAAIP